MKWFILWLIRGRGPAIGCMYCKHYITPPKHTWTELAKCEKFKTYAELARNNETMCGLKGTGFIEAALS